MLVAYLNQVVSHRELLAVASGAALHRHNPLSVGSTCANYGANQNPIRRIYAAS